MPIRQIPSDMPAEPVSRVDALLDGIVREHGVRIGLAVESGSRAWGFPSPDSDFDGRFIYVRPAAQALTIWPRRDVIETPLVSDLDVNGWDLAKALRLLLKGNAVVVEWLQSPIVYRGDAVFRARLLDFAQTWLERGRVATHYLHLGSRQKTLHLDGQSEVPLKKVFYALRPAAALRWMRIHPDRAVAPMHFPTLMTECNPPVEVARLAADLIARKAVIREMGEGRTPVRLLDFIEEEFEQASTFAVSAPGMPSDAAKQAADEVFVDLTARMDTLAAEGLTPV